jgi:hypothetical protein
MVGTLIIWAARYIKGRGVITSKEEGRVLETCESRGSGLNCPGDAFGLSSLEGLRGEEASGEGGDI